jgi:hypothetical protein
MDVAWIQVFILTLTECVAPAGKMVCQEREIELQFLTQNDCEAALEQLVTAKDALETVIVDRARSGCAPSAREHPVYPSLEAVSQSVADSSTWKDPTTRAAVPGPARQKHEARLESLPTCEQAEGLAPCKIGEIIIEEASESTDVKSVEVWRRDQ